MVRDLDLSQVPGVDGKRSEVVAEGLTLFRGAQLAIDVTLSAHCVATGLPGQVLRPNQVQHSKSREGGRNARTLNWQERAGQARRPRRRGRRTVVCRDSEFLDLSGTT